MQDQPLFSYDTVQTYNATEIQIYKYIISNLEKIPYMTIRELAAAVTVSASTILRFCHKNGCESYREFKALIDAYISVSASVIPGSDLQELMHYFQSTNTKAFEEKVQAGADLLRAAEQIIFIGMGGSGALANYGARYFSNLGIFSIGLTDQYYPFTRPLPLKTAVVALSVTGESAELIEFAGNIQAQGSKILSITNLPDSTLAKLSDWNISYCVNLQRVNGDFNATTQVPVLFLIEVLARRI